MSPREHEDPRHPGGWGDLRETVKKDLGPQALVPDTEFGSCAAPMKSYLSIPARLMAAPL